MIKEIKNFFLTHPLLLLTVCYLLFRLPHLTLLPIFIDEATFLDWGWRTIHVPGLFFLPLVWSKMPLVMWLFGLVQTVFTDPLVAGRLVSIFFGWFALTGLFFLSRLYFDFKTGFGASFLYIITPIFVFFDRQALMESALAATGIWTCFCLSLFLKLPSLRRSAVLGFVLGLGYLVKANGLIFLAATFIVIFFSAVRHPSSRWPLLTYSLYIFTVFLLTLSPVLYQPAFWKTAGDIFYFSLTPREATHLPFVFWAKNSFSHLEISFWHLTPLLFISVILGLKKTFPLAVWTALTLIITTLATREATVRYLVPYLPPLLIFAANWLSRQKFYLSFLFTLPCLLFTVLLIFNPPAYFRLLSRVTRYSQMNYLTDKNTGYQAKATIDYLNKFLPSGPVYLGVAANAGNPEQAVFAYLRRRPNTTVGYLDDHVLTIPLTTFDCLSASIPVYYIARHNEQGGLERFYKPVATVTNPVNDEYNTIYTLKSCTGNSLNIDSVISYYQASL